MHKKQTRKAFNSRQLFPPEGSSPGTVPNFSDSDVDDLDLSAFNNPSSHSEILPNPHVDEHSPVLRGATDIERLDNLDDECNQPVPLRYVTQTLDSSPLSSPHLPAIEIVDDDELPDIESNVTQVQHVPLFPSSPTQYAQQAVRSSSLSPAPSSLQALDMDLKEVEEQSPRVGRRREPMFMLQRSLQNVRSSSLSPAPASPQERETQLEEQPVNENEQVPTTETAEHEANDDEQESPNPMEKVSELVSKVGENGRAGITEVAVMEAALAVLDAGRVKFGTLLEWISDRTKGKGQVRDKQLFRMSGLVSRVLSHWAKGSETSRKIVHKWSMEYMKAKLEQEGERVTSSGILRTAKKDISPSFALGFRLGDVYNDLSERDMCPDMISLLHAFATTKRQKKNMSVDGLQKKTKFITGCLAILLGARSQRNSHIRHIMGLYLYTQGAQRQVISVMSSLGVCCDYTTLVGHGEGSERKKQPKKKKLTNPSTSHHRSRRTAAMTEFSDASTTDDSDYEPEDSDYCFDSEYESGSDSTDLTEPSDSESDTNHPIPSSSMPSIAPGGPRMNTSCSDASLHEVAEMRPPRLDVDTGNNDAPRQAVGNVDDHQNDIVSTRQRDRVAGHGREEANAAVVQPKTTDNTRGSQQAPSAKRPTRYDPGLLKQLSHSCRDTARGVATTELDSEVYDNLNIRFRVAEQVVGRTDSQENGTCATLIELVDTKPEDIRTIDHHNAI
ncbi:hypothetical protein EIP91_001980 [Steccherinum ochraceum]|uniref:Uncharacterized protein n=1 Tax=Steccherinum ochraceum TaxID=92696 RepID=A0A4R0RCY4_9APHY|nr:hypothetical protein EIP91_001980 [Steccherinum ochraceum]